MSNQVTFTEWLAASIEEVKSGTASYQGQRVTESSQAVRYFLCYSFIVITSWRTTEYFLMDTDIQKKTAVTSTLFTFLAGWWGIFGLFLTPYFFIRDLIGGEKLTVGDLIRLLENPAEMAKKNDAYGNMLGKFFIGVLALLVVLVVCMQIYIFIHKNLTPHT
jgi:hypothetical protein